MWGEQRKREGSFRLKLTYDRIVKGERKFQIREYAQPRLNINIQLRSQSYGPGDLVIAALEVRIEQ